MVLQLLVQKWEFADTRDYDHEVAEANYETTSVYGFGHPLYYKNVLDVMRGKANLKLMGEQV